jgi:hypothetical protein
MRKICNLLRLFFFRNPELKEEVKKAMNIVEVLPTFGLSACQKQADVKQTPITKLTYGNKLRNTTAQTAIIIFI